VVLEGGAKAEERGRYSQKELDDIVLVEGAQATE